MKKNILIIALFLIATFSMIYASIKADEAEKSAFEANLSRQEAEKLRDEALVLQEAAQESAAEARRQEALSLDLREELEACKSK